LPYEEMSAFMATLQEQESIGARALEFLILTVTRTSETIGARWPEIDMQNKVWTIPASRIKAGKEHRVPLAPRSIAILKEMTKAGTGEAGSGEFVFSGRRPKQPLSNMALLAVLKRMERGDLTVHGFRSSFRDWAAESTSYPSEVAEMALTHAVGDKV